MIFRCEACDIPLNPTDGLSGAPGSGKNCRSLTSKEVRDDKNKKIVMAQLKLSPFTA